MREISAPEMGLILGPLERLFKSLSETQREIYHEKLKFMPEKYLNEAVEYWLDFGKAFPRPGELKKETWKARAADPNYKNSEEVSGCAHCLHGWVEFTIPNHGPYAPPEGFHEVCNPCAYCIREHTAPLVILRDGHIYWACREMNSGRWKQDVNNLVEVPGSYPGNIKERYKHEEERQKKKDETEPF